MPRLEPPDVARASRPWDLSLKSFSRWCSIGFPVFDKESGNAPEFIEVTGDQHRAQAQGLACDEHVIRSYGLGVGLEGFQISSFSVKSPLQGWCTLIHDS